jgi:hypothetical protein
MNSTEIYERLSTLLDESTAQYFTNDERWAALTDGQQEYTSIVLAQYKAKSIINPGESIPEILRALYVGVSSTTGDSFIANPSDFLYDISLSLGAPYSRPLLKRPLSRTIPFEKANSYSGTSGYYYSITASQILLEIPQPTNPGGLAYTLEYLKKPTKIDANTNPILPEYTHFAIVIFAFAQLLKKSARIQEALTQYQEFIQQIKYL